MSHAMYNALWVDTQKYIESTVAIDQDAAVAGPERRKKVAHRLLSTLHTRYVDIIKRMEACYDQIVQPQKRIVIRTLLDMCLGRCLELKHEMVELDISDFNYFDNVLIEMKLVPMEVEVTIPNYYVRAREEEIERRKEHMAEIMAKLSLEAKPPVAEPHEVHETAHVRGYLSSEEVVRVRPPPERTSAEILLTESILTIQRSERARRGRQLATSSARIKAIKVRAAEGKKMSKEEKKEQEKAAIVIQKFWRKYRIKRHQKYRKDQEALLIGLHTPSWVPTEARKKHELVRSYRHGLQKLRQQEFEEAMAKEKAKILKVKGPWIMEDFCDEIRAWFIDWYRKTFKFGDPTFPDFPDEEDGGTFLLISGKLQTPEQWIKLQIEIAKFKAKSKQEKDKIKKEKEKAKAKEKALKLKEKELAKKRAKEARDAPWPGFIMKESKFVPPLENATTEYTEVWKNKPEKDNPHQKYYLDMISVEKRAEVEVDVRPLCDDLMRLELEQLEAALERDRKKMKGKKKKKKKKKKKRRKKKKKKKDPTGDRTTEDLFEELFRNGIIHKYPEAKLSSFIGDFSYNNFNLRDVFKDPLPSLGDIRQVVLEYCILPMGSPVVHQLAPHIKSVCLAGPSGCGKHLLANAICTELGAVMFDLTPSNVVGKYPGKKGAKMLIHLVDKMSKILQPSVIFIDGAEKPWYKKVPKPERKDEPKKLAKLLPKILKTMTPADQVMLLGISKQPWAGKPKKITKTFQKIIMIPWADYGTRFHHWHTLLMNYHGIARDFDASSLAKVSQGYTLKQIADVVAKIMSARRIATLKGQPLTPAEVMEELVLKEPLLKKDMDKFTTWFTKKTVLGKKKAKYLGEVWERMAALALEREAMKK